MVNAGRAVGSGECPDARRGLHRAFGRPLAIEEVALAPPGPFQIAVRLAAVAICHSTSPMPKAPGANAARGLWA